MAFTRPKQAQRTYVQVNSDFDSTGYMQPRSIIWKDGRTSLAPGDHDNGDSPEEKSAPGYYIEDFIRECLCDGAYEILDIFRTDNPDLVFHNQKVVKGSVAGINDYVSIRDYQAGRYSGVIDSRYKTMALYTAPVFSIFWSRWSTEKEIGALHVCRKERSFLQSDAMPLFEYYAGLIVTGVPDSFLFCTMVWIMSAEIKRKCLAARLIICISFCLQRTAPTSSA